MKPIFADYNAATESGDLRLNFSASQKDIATAHLHPGDWAWLCDGEVMVGAQLAIDDRYGVVGVPDWDTIVHLDDEGADDFDRVRDELKPLVTKEPPSMEDEPRILELLTQLEYFAPPHLRDSLPEMLVFRRALALRHMGKLGLALLDMEAARGEHPDDPEVAFVYLDLLRIEDLPSAVAEAETITGSPGVPALVLSACINILATQAEQTPDEQFESIAERVLALCRRFDQAPDLDQAGLSLEALSYFNRGIVHLRAGRISQARRAFERAHEIYPVGPMLDQLARLQTYDHHAREVARSVREIAERWVPTTTVAA
ncbi:MAG: tetratricopeptide repeat protein [Isosphaerales bacterium]